MLVKTDLDCGVELFSVAAGEPPGCDARAGLWLLVCPAGPCRGFYVF